MRKYKTFYMAAFLLIICIPLVLFAGCQGGAAQAANSGPNAGGNGQNGRGMDPAQRKEQIQNDIKSLVTDGTINQSQADKIVEALTANTQRGNGQGFGQNNPPGNNQNGAPGNNGSQANTQNNGQGSGNGGTQNNGQGNRQFSNPLSQLVTDGVITQAQADAVMQKVRGNFQRPQGGQGSQNNQGGQPSQGSQGSGV